MKKEKITFNQLTAGALLKFGKLDSIDMTLLMGGIFNFAELIQNEYDYMNNYFMVVNGNILLNEDYVRKYYQTVNTELLEKMQGSLVKEYMDNLEMREFVLRKIKLLGDSCIISFNDVNKNFSIPQMKTMNWLYQERCIMNCHKNVMSCEEYTIKLTKRGELYLYLIDNKKEVEEFIKVLKEYGYSDLLLDAFLISQDLRSNSKNILTLDTFLQFCTQNNSCLFELTEREYSYKKVRVPVK